MATFPPPTHASLEALSQGLAVHLHAKDWEPELAVSCVEHGGRLLVLAQHDAPEVSDPNPLLKSLEAAIADVMPALGLADAAWAGVDAVPLRIYLRLTSAHQPYAMHTFTWRLEDAARVVFPVTQNFPPDSLAPNQADSDKSAASTEGHTPAESEAAAKTPQSLLNPSSVSPKGEGSALSDVALALPSTAIQPPGSSSWQQQGRWLGNRVLWFMRYYWSYGVAALILFSSGLFAYALTRPCVVGSCDRLDQAEEFYGLAQATLTVNPKEDDLMAAQSDLQAAIDIVSPIPNWSSHHPTAQDNLDRYQDSITALNAILQAKDIANQAANLSQNPPHPVERWVNVHLLWQQAIDRLETIPADNPAFDYAQKKRHEYRENHSAIGRRIVAEEEAEANFSTAIQTGQLAQQRMETANSLAGWQLAAKEWQAAIKGLSLIPRGTMVYAEAQAQLQVYQQQLMRSTNQATLEEASARNYDQAVQAARAAAASEAKNQWSQAVSQWQQAVASAQQIPGDTILTTEGTRLLETYQPALTNAQNRLRTAVALQGLTTTLGEMCAQDVTPCTVQEDSSQVQVVLTSQYAEPLRQAITPPAADGTFGFANELSPTVKQLIEQIITFSHQVNRQVAIYDSRGGFVARYRPDLGGFVKN
ncbi:MAG: hypothetical protein HC929_07445 [Leptolyngbyaceae cyanobacterium SM2_5_2]|nr:hypothetical protein [Leptolyngbyaceae cyanobacterium SM2_5_2]